MGYAMKFSSGIAAAAVLTFAFACRETPTADQRVTRTTATQESTNVPTQSASPASAAQPTASPASVVRDDLAFDPAWPPLPGSPQSVASAASIPVKEAYAYAANRPDVMKHVPCYCGCEQQGHDSAEDCFVKRRTADGGVAEWDSMGFT